MQDKKQIISSVVVVAIVVIVIWGFTFINNLNSPAITDITGADGFAKCLTEKGFIMYGTEWCGYCANEKKAFGDSFKLINYVDCGVEAQLCVDKGINGVPTWIDGSGVKYEGAQGLSGLAEISGCELPQ